MSLTYDSENGRTDVDSAKISIYTEPNFHDELYLNRMVVPTDDDVSVFDLGDLVADRIEANGGVTFPDDLPAEGERKPLGTVFWDQRGIPTTLLLEDGGAVLFTPDGGVDDVVDAEHLDITADDLGDA